MNAIDRNGIAIVGTVGNLCVRFVFTDLIIIGLIVRVCLCGEVS